jgi:multicomponent Na+:H+ antiporter subunit C
MAEAGFFEIFLARYPYWATTILMVIGVYGMLAKRSLVKKLIGLNVFQSAIILFYIAGSEKAGGTIPIIVESGNIDPDLYVNPLPHVLMLTAIVVSAATLGLALTFMVVIFREYGTLDEREILGRVKRS